MVSQAPLDLQQEQADLLGDMLAEADLAASYRDSSIPEGTLLGEAEIQGQQVKWKKQKAMVRSGNTPLPERFEAFDRNGISSMLPTAQMSKMLSKPRADDPTVRAFHTHSRLTTRASCIICPPAREPIESTCEFCLERSAGAVRKVFYSEANKRSHQRAFHENQLIDLETAQDRAQRDAEIETNRNLANAMMEMARAQAESVKHAAAAETAATPVKAKP